MNRKYGCAVLAGGKGRRMGQLNKAELVYDGRTFLRQICSELEKAGMKGYISTANYKQDIPGGWTMVRDCVASDDGKYIGPIGGIYSCLVQAERDGLEGLFFAPCDAPCFSTRVIHVLNEAIETDRINVPVSDLFTRSNADQQSWLHDPDAAVIRTADGRLQTTFGWYSTSCISCLKQNIGQEKYKLAKLLEHLNTRIISSEETGLDDNTFRNINHINEYRSLNAEKDAEMYQAYERENIIGKE